MGVPKSRHQQIQLLVRGHFLIHLESSILLFPYIMKGIRMLSGVSNTTPKALPANIINLEVRTSSQKFGETHLDHSNYL
jgi:hypothetical protein